MKTLVVYYSKTGNTKLIAEGRVLNISKSLGVSEGTLKNEAGKLYAHATAICMIFST